MMEKKKGESGCRGVWESSTDTERRKKERENDKGRGDDCSSGRELAVNNEKRLVRRAPGKAKTTAPVETDSDTLRTPLTVSPPHSRNTKPNPGLIQIFKASFCLQR